MFGWGKKDKCDSCPTAKILEDAMRLESETIRTYRDRMETLTNYLHHFELRYLDLKEENEGLRKELKKLTGKEKVQFT
jgi:hypothetical protein